MPETICDSNISPICIIPTKTAIEAVTNTNMSTGKIIGTFGPEIMGIVWATALIAWTKRWRNLVKKVAKAIDNLWMKMVVEPDRQRYAHFREKKDV